jgi:hypothetical protein
MPRWAAKVDGNHGLLVEALRAYGWVVRDTSRVGQGFPDLLIAKRGRTVLVEVKTPKGRLEEAQKVFLMEWPGEWAILTSLDDVERFNDSIDQSQPVRLTFTGDLRNLER